MSKFSILISKFIILTICWKSISGRYLALIDDDIVDQLRDLDLIEDESQIENEANMNIVTDETPVTHNKKSKSKLSHEIQTHLPSKRSRYTVDLDRSSLQNLGRNRTNRLRKVIDQNNRRPSSFSGTKYRNRRDNILMIRGTKPGIRRGGSNKVGGGSHVFGKLG